MKLVLASDEMSRTFISPPLLFHLDTILFLSLFLPLSSFFPCLSQVISHFNQIRSHLRIAVVSRR